MKEGWEEKRLGEIQTGTTPPTKDKNNYGDYIPFVKPANFEEKGNIKPDDLGLSEEGLNSVSRATAIRDLKELVSTGVLKRVGRGKSIVYK